MRQSKWALLILMMTMTFVASCQPGDSNSNENSLLKKNQRFVNTHFHQVKKMNASEISVDTSQVKNVILMIGDGMGTTQIFAGAAANKGSLNLLNFPNTGFITTHASDNDITDSAAGATALACGVKTYNGAIGVDSTGSVVETILETAEKAGLATGLVATCRITHATPASFIAHQPSRQLYENIAMDFLKTDIEVFIGGGRNNFLKRKDNLNLIDSLVKKGYTVVTDPDSLIFIENGKLAGLIDPEDQARYSGGRGNMLENATKTALNILDNDPDGFFLMIEGAQIDWGGHDNNTEYLVEEMLDFDRVAGIVLEFALQNPGTLIIITADHETGGFSIVDTDKTVGMVEGAFTTGNHTGVMVPVFAFGPQSYRFTGIFDNTKIYHKMKEVLGF